MERSTESSRFFSKYVKRTLVWLGVLSVVIIGGVSYITLRKLTFGNHSTTRKEKYLEAVQERRFNLINNYGAQPVSFVTDDKIDLSGLLVLRKQARFNLLLCHGFRSNKEALHRLVKAFPEANTLLFDFRAHGQSQGEFTTIGFHEYQDVIAAARYLKRQGPSLPLIILGLSMGGASSLKAVALEPDIADGLIIDSSYASLYDIVQKTFSKYSGLPGFPFLPVMEFILEHMAGFTVRAMKPVEFVKEIKKPLFFIHSCCDTHTSPRDTVQMYEAASQSVDKQIWIGPLSEHSLLHKEHPELYRQKIMGFLSGILPQ